MLRLRSRSAAACVAALAALTAPTLTAPSTATPDDTTTDDTGAPPVALGTPLTDVRVDGGDAITRPDGVSAVYGVTSGEPAKLVAVDAHTGETLLSEPLPGASSSYSVVALDNGDVYTSTNANGGLYRLRWGADSIEDLGSPIEGDTFAWDITEGPDGRVYGTTYPGAHLYAFDPATGDVQDYGAVTSDTPQARTVASSGGKIYVGTITPAHLFEIDPATGDRREIALPPESDPGSQLSSVFDVNAAGDDLLVRIGTDIKYAPLYRLDLATGNWGPSLDQVAGLEVSDPGPSGEVYVMRNNVLIAWNPATGETTDTPVTYPGRVYNYRGVGWVDLDDPEWPGQTLVGFFWRGELWRYNPQTGRGEVEPTNVPGEPIEIISLERAHDGGVWAGGFLGGFAHVDPADGTPDFHRFSQTEYMYDDGEALWLGAYPDARGYRYDPDKPFNDPDYSPGPPGTEINPVKRWDFKQHPASAQDRVFAMHPVGADTVLAATGPKGPTFGGSLVIDDAGTIRIVDDLAPNRALTSLAETDGVVFAGTWVNGGTGSPAPIEDEGTVLAYDLASGETLWQTSPVAGATSYVGTTLDAEGRLWTLAGNVLAEIDPATGAAIRTVELGEPVTTTGATFPWRAGIVEPAPEGDVLYVDVGGSLYRVTTASGAAEALGTFPYDVFTVLDGGDIAMTSGAELYRWTPPVKDDIAPTVAVGVTYVDADRRPHLEVTTADEGGSGVATVEYRLDTHDWARYTGPVPIRPGRHHVESRVTDAAGNTTTDVTWILATPRR